MLDLLKAKIESYETQIKNHVANADILNTIKTELENIYNEFLSAEPVLDSVLETVDPSVATDVQVATNAVESVVNATE